jgi:hypothetical protein
MGIKGLTDRGLALPEKGQIRKGAKKGERTIGKDLTYFRVEFDETEKKAASDFIATYGTQPTAIRIILPFNERDRMWDAWLEAYTAGRMIARSDGEFIQYQLDDRSDLIVQNGMDKNGNKVPHPANNIAGKDQKGRAVKFKHSGRLKVIVPELSRAAYLTVMTNWQPFRNSITDNSQGYHSSCADETSRSAHQRKMAREYAESKACSASRPTQSG